MNPKKTAYMGHTIRGRMGNDATDEHMERNNFKAGIIGQIIQFELKDVLDLYVPGDMDAHFLERGVRPIDIVEEVLTLDEAIIGSSDLLIVYTPDGYISGGMQREIDHAKMVGVPIVQIEDASQYNISLIEKALFSDEKQGT